MPEWSQGFTLTQNVDWGFLHSTTFPTSGVITQPIIYKCLLKVLWPVRRLITTLDCVLLKDNNQALVARSGPEINSRACLCVLQGPRHNSDTQRQGSQYLPPTISLESYICSHSVLLMRLNGDYSSEDKQPHSLCNGDAVCFLCVKNPPI